MIRIRALNEPPSESESEEEDVPTVTEDDAQEQLALTEYNKALGFINSNQKDEALQIFQDLLETELLDQVTKPEVQDGRSGPMLSLKYSCFRNMGLIQSESGNDEEAIHSYWEAANLDDTDVMLWYRIGKLALKTFQLQLACFAFKQGLEQVPNHWLCLDNIITAMYAVTDYENCLIYISLALQRDPTFIKGLAFREIIFKTIPCLISCCKLYKWELNPPLDADYDHVLGDKFLVEADELACHWAGSCKSQSTLKPLPDLMLRKPLLKHSWLELGRSLIDMHDYITDNNLNFVSHVNLVTLAPVDEEMPVVNASPNSSDAQKYFGFGKGVDDSMDTMMDMYQLFSKDGVTDGTQSSGSSKPTSSNSSDAQKYFGSEEERSNVEEFISKHSGKSNLMIALAKYTEFLSLKWSQEWPEELPAIYIEVYNFMRQHIPHASLDDDDDSILETDGEMTLLFCELSTDAWLQNKPEELPSPTLDKLGIGIPSEELGYIIIASTRVDDATENNVSFHCRLLWLKANIFHCQGDIDIVIDTLEVLLNLIKQSRNEAIEISLTLVNCKHNSRINIRVVEKFLSFFRDISTPTPFIPAELSSIFESPLVCWQKLPFASQEFSIPRKATKPRQENPMGKSHDPMSVLLQLQQRPHQRFSAEAARDEIYRRLGFWR